MRLAVLAVPGLWLARGDSESCGELSVESLFGAIPQREDEWLRWVAARPNQPAAALRAAEVLRGPATEQSVQEAWREVETIQLDGCESAELVGWFRFRYFQWLPKTDLSALEQQLRQCSGSALEVAAGLLLSRDGTQTPEALKLLAEAGPSLRLALALHSSGEKSAVASLTPRAQQELKLSEEGRDFDELLLATFGALTVENLPDFVECAAQWWLRDGIMSQVEAFRLGVEDVCDSPAIWAFEAQELKELFCGAAAPNWTEEDLKQHLKFRGGYTAASPVVQLLIQELVRFSPEHKSQFLEFVTACPRLPHGGLAAAEIAVVAQPKGKLPRAHTCTNELQLPSYDSVEELSAKLFEAMGSARGMYE